MTTPEPADVPSPPAAGPWAAPRSVPTMAPPPTTGPSSPPWSPPTSPPTASLPTDGGERRRRRLWPIATAVGLMVLIAFGAIVAVPLLRRGDDTGRASSAFRLDRVAPDAIEPKFEARGAISGKFGRLVAAPRDEGRIVQYDENGDERWSLDVPAGWALRGIAAEVGGRVPIWVADDDRDQGGFIRFADGDTGELTDTEIDVDSQDVWFVGSIDDRFYVTLGNGVQLYDPASGDLLAEVIGDDVIMGSWTAAFFSITGSRVSVYDLDLQPIATDLESDSEQWQWTVSSRAIVDHDVVDGALVTVRDNLIVGVDDTGEAWTLDPELGDLRFARSFGDDRWLLGLATGDMVIVSGVGTGDVEELWRRPDMARASRVGDDHILFAATMLLIDDDGTELYETGDGNWVPNIPVDNGFLVERRHDDVYEVTFVDLAGEERWAIETSAPNNVVVLDNAVVNLDDWTIYGPA